jgi:hypothetical protein
MAKTIARLQRHNRVFYPAQFFSRPKPKSHSTGQKYPENHIRDIMKLKNEKHLSHMDGP